MIIPSDLVIPIITGTLRGSKWVIGSSNLECVLGTYEFKKQSMFKQELSNNDIVYDIGAHAGFYTLLASKLVGEEGRVVSFEPVPQNFQFLQNHVVMNECKNVIINKLAVSDFDGSSMFQEGEGTYTGHLAKNGQMPVKTITLDTFLQKNPDLIPNCLKIDVEGAEFSLLKGSKLLIEDFHPKIFLATHNASVHKKCINFLLGHNYQLKFINKKIMKYLPFRNVFVNIRRYSKSILM